MDNPQHFLVGQRVKVIGTFTDPDRVDAPLDPTTGHTLFDPLEVWFGLQDGDGTVGAAIQYGVGTPPDPRFTRLGYGRYQMEFTARRPAGSWTLSMWGTDADGYLAPQDMEIIVDESPFRL